MRILSFIAALLCLFNIEASHLMGGEITYTYLSGNSYRFNVTLYRDCNECTIGNQGGGTSTSNCNDLDELYVRTITSSCGNTYLSPIKLTKTGYTNITSVCNLDNSACGNNPTISYGIEAHQYTGTINFANYTTYTNCMFEVFFQSPERNENINILAQEEQKLYVSARINPWKENISSPQFTSEPRLIFPVNEPAYGGDYVSQVDGDSLVYKWVQPLKNYNTPIPYSSGYSAQNFIDAYCLAGDNCSPNHTSTPPRGLYLNSTSGDYAFTPISSDQHGTRVVEIEQWRKHSDAYYLAGKVRRDVIVIVNTSNNHTPVIVANDSYEVCEGETFNLSISAFDSTYLPFGKQDSVALKAIHTLSGLTSTRSTSSSAPYQNLVLNIETDSSHIGSHIIRIQARDNHCPMYGFSEKTITLKVHPAPQATFSINDVFCGNNLIEATASDTLDYRLTINGTKSTQPLPYTYTNYTSEMVNYKFVYTNSYGCADSSEQNILNVGNSITPTAILHGDTSICNGAKLNHWLTHREFEISSINWEIANTNYTQDTLNTAASIEKINYTYSLKKNQHFCELEDSFMLDIQQAPKVNLRTEPSVCFVSQLDLSNTDVVPNDGQWSYNNTSIPTSFELGRFIPNLDIDAELMYTVTDSQTQCKTTIPVTLHVKQAPDLQLKNQQICASENPFNLNNIISRPFNYSTANIDWEMLTMIGAYYHDGITPKIDVPSYGSGMYELAAKNSLPNGCIARDTVHILVDEEIQLASNGQTKGCQTNDAVLLQELFNMNIEGGNWSSDIPDVLYYDSLRTQNYCGDIMLKYVYDMYGCYDELDIPFTIVCRPTFNIALPDSICTDANSINLPSLYQWQGTGVTDNLLDPSLLNEGITNLSAGTTVQQCQYDTSVSITALAPLNFTLNTNATTLCEGEVLRLELDAPTYAKLQLENCGNLSTFITDSYTYTPTSCDLANQKINLNVSSFSHLLCPSHTKSLSVPYLEKPQVSLSSLGLKCEPYNLDVTAIGDNLKHVDYKISTTDNEWLGTGLRLLANKLPAGNYQLDINLEHTNGCTATQTVVDYLSIHPTPIASIALLGQDRVTLSKRQLMLSSYSTISSGQLTNKWYYTKQGVSTLFSQQDNPILELPLDTGVFTLTLVAESNKFCTDTARTTVTVVPDIIAFIPNAFTPDNKGPESNSVFRVTSDHASKFHIEIFNKWGQKVFSSDNIEEGWNGTYLGQYCQDGVYVYAIELVNHAGSLYKYQGTVNLLR